MATKWLRDALGSRLKKDSGRRRGLFSDSEVVCEVPVPFRICFPNSPGRNPDFAFILSILGDRCRAVSQTEVARIAGKGLASMYPVTVKTQKVQERRVLLKDYKNYSRSTNDEEDCDVDEESARESLKNDSSPRRGLRLMTKRV